MERVIDRHKLLKKNIKKFNNDYINDVKMLNDILDMIMYTYQPDDPEIIYVNLTYDLEIDIVDRSYPNIIYHVTIPYNNDKIVTVDISNKSYQDIYEIDGEFAFFIARCYLNKENNSSLKRCIESSNKSMRHKIIYNHFVYEFNNQKIHALIDLEMPGTIPFVENIFAKVLLKNNINNIEELFQKVRTIISYPKIYLRITNQTIYGDEVIDVRLDKLYEYKRIYMDKIVEYKDGYTNLLITRREPLEQEEFQKTLKLIGVKK